MFVTDEGYTFQPGSTAIEPDVENLQVLGFGVGSNVHEAFRNFLATHHWVTETSFQSAMGFAICEDTESPAVLDIPHAAPGTSLNLG